MPHELGARVQIICHLILLIDFYLFDSQFNSLVNTFSW